MGFMVSHLELHDSDPSPVILFLPRSDNLQHGCSVRPLVKPSVIARQDRPLNGVEIVQALSSDYTLFTSLCLFSPT
jgi:hypothetical protein